MTYYSDVFNKLYEVQTSSHLSASLLAFLKNDLYQYLINHNLLLENVLEVGCGSKSLFENWPSYCEKIAATALDCSSTAIKKAKLQLPYSKINYQIVDITDPNILNIPNGQLSFLIPQDLVLDGHALHFIKDLGHRKTAFKNIYNILKQNGLFVAECTIRTNSFQASEYFYLPYAHELENEILSAGFELKLFIVKPGLHLESFEVAVVERFEVVTFIAIKK